MRGGPVTVTADGVVGIEDKPTVLYGASITSGATAGLVKFIDGDASGDTLMFEASGEPNLKALVSGIPAQGIMFPNGIYLDIDANVSAVTCWIEVQTTA